MKYEYPSSENFSVKMICDGNVAFLKKLWYLSKQYGCRSELDTSFKRDSNSDFLS